MGKYELLRHLFRAIGGKQPKLRKIKSIPAENVKILTEVPKLVHADARIYGETPVEFRVKPGAVTIISGFPPPEHSAFRTRTYLDL
jgi:diacylglycerol kinase family enzyme